ncbi:MAG: aminopeptidase [Cellvibrionaceae bacterium]
MSKTKVLVIVVCLFLLLLNGCSTIGYYSQSVIGHTSLMLARKPIDDVLETADDKLKKKLSTAVEIRRFASSHLSLPDNKSYTSYVQLKNDPPIWNVVAAEPFSLKAKQWCYLVIGCASYRGYYNKTDAEKYSEKMKAEGYDVALIGATAYSTLGWFADPLTSAMLRRSDASLAELMFHELAHQQFYIKNDSRFNEAFASAVGEQGAMVWMNTTGQQELLSEYLLRLSVRDDFLVLINETKVSLKALYESDLDIDGKSVGKEKIFSDMKLAYEELKKNKWNNKGWYDRWFSYPVNNARLVAIATYRDLVPSFIALFERCDKKFDRFYQRVEAISKTQDKDLHVDCGL